MTATEKTPHDFDAEQAMLGCLLAAPSRLFAVDLADGHFHVHRHRVIFRALRKLAERDALPETGEDAIDAVLAELRTHGESITRSDLTEFVLYDPVTPQGSYRVLEDFRRRRVLRVASRTLEKIAITPGLVLEDELPDAMAVLETATRSPVDDHHVHDFAGAVRDHAERLDGGVEGGGSAWLRTGIGALDDLTGGLPRRGLTVLAASTSTGKSALALQIALQVARAGGRVLYATPEMDVVQLADRFLAQEARIDVSRFGRPNGLDAGGRSACAAAAARAPAGVTVFDAGAQRTGEIIALAHRLHVASPLSLVVVDHLHYLADPVPRHETLVSELGRRTKLFKALARRLGCALLLCAQLNRSAADRVDKHPLLSDLRYSGEIEQDADIVLLMHRSSVSNATAPDDQLELAIAKNRNGPIGHRRLTFEAATMRFLDIRPAGPVEQEPLQ